MLSLVDYASSSSDDDVEEDTIEQETRNDTKQVAKREPSPPKMPTTDRRSGLASDEQVRLQNNAHPSVTPVMKLPDASLLLNSPSVSPMNGSDHASRVSAAMAENASRKRESNGLSSSLPRNKIPKGTLRQTKSVPDTVGGLLVPPQLSGRSNVLTEDLGKLFVRKHSELSTELNTSE
ncbi:hypothetical protein K2173_025045 [Erythroxylum novogranatense]|uniref:Uncharacterized protein n=1 Tax=Erythroxylum novogranatense TaxID=1862640 RepID=A0AAV8UD33_9ROSI|nr:hypothetical protein K2173_025045 [Erythroxylum novogranatense]